MSEQFKRISSEDVRARMVENKAKGDKSVLDAAMVGLAQGPMPVVIDAMRPYALQMRHRPLEGSVSELGWSLHPWRFPDVYSASSAAKALGKLDPRLEIRIAKAAGS